MSNEQVSTQLPLRLGQLVATPVAIALMAKLGIDPSKLIERHRNGDWSELCDEDRQANAEAIVHGERILSSYPVDDGVKLWVITERDRSVTTILIPNDY